MKEKEQLMGQQNNLETFPFMNGSDFIGFGVLSIQNRKDQKEVLEITSKFNTIPLDIEKYCLLQSVPVEGVIGSIGMQSWDDIYNQLPSVYVQEIVNKMQTGTYPLILKSPLLIRIDGMYIDCGVGTTIASAKIAR